MKKIILFCILSLYFSKNIFAGGLEGALLSGWADAKASQRLNYSYEVLMRDYPDMKQKMMKYRASELTECLDEMAQDQSLNQMRVSEATVSCIELLEFSDYQQ